MHISEAKFPFLVQCGSCEAVSIYVEVLLLFHPFLCHSESESQPQSWGRRTTLSGLTFTVLSVPLEEMKYRVSPFSYFRLPIIVSHFQFFRSKVFFQKSPLPDVSEIIKLNAPYFRPNYQHPFWYSEFLVHVFHYSTIISTKKLSLYIHIPGI